MSKSLMRSLALSVLLLSGCIQLNALHSGSVHHASTQPAHSQDKVSTESGIEHISAFNKIARFDGDGVIFSLAATEITEDQHRRMLILQKKNQVSHYFTAGFDLLTFNVFSGSAEIVIPFIQNLAFTPTNRRHLLCRVFQI